MVVSHLAVASDGLGFEGDDYLSDIPVVLTVTRLPQSRAELPTAVTVIDHEMIEASGAVELTDLFRLVAGYQIGHYHGPDGPRTAVTYHGNTNQYSRRMQVLIDGRSVYTWGTGGAEWTDLPVAIDDIERIEVSRGPNGVTYGSNAFLGVINIITRHTAGQQGTRATVTVDDDQYRETALRYAGSRGDFTYRISANYKQDNGFEDYVAADGSRSELNDDTRTTALTFRGDYRAGVNDYLMVQLGGAAGPRETGASTDVTSPIRERQATTHYQQLKWQHIIDSDSEVNAQLYHHLHKVDDQFQIEVIPNIPADTGLQSERYDLELSHRFRLSDSVRLVWGGELRLDEVTAADYFDTGERYQQRISRLFFNGEWRPTERWVVNLGDMVEQSSLVGSMHSPRLAINRLLGEAGYARVSAGRAYRTPTAVEEYANYTVRLADGTLITTLYDSSGALAPERIDSIEFAIGAEQDVASYEVKLFREQISSEIDAVSNPIPASHWTMSQAGETTVEGAELQLKARTDDALLSFSYATTQASGWHLSDINPEQVVDVTNAVPRNTLNMLLSFRLSAGLWAGVNYYSVSPMRFYSGDKTNGVQSADFTLSKSFKVSGHQAKLRLLAKDLLGSYFDFEKETVSSKRSYLTLQMDF
jgi:iron complex outermembrane receptor protein